MLTHSQSNTLVRGWAQWVGGSLDASYGYVSLCDRLWASPAGLLLWILIFLFLANFWSSDHKFRAATLPTHKVQTVNLWRWQTVGWITYVNSPSLLAGGSCNITFHDGVLPDRKWFSPKLMISQPHCLVSSHLLQYWPHLSDNWPCLPDDWLPLPAQNAVLVFVFTSSSGKPLTLMPP